MVNHSQWVEEIRKYYETHSPELPPYPNFRYFKLVWKYPNRTAIHIRDRIRTPEQLQRYLIRYKPQHVYYSLTTWLNPTTVHGRNSGAIPLWSDLVFDVDAGKLSKAKEETKKLVNYLKSMGYKEFKILFTGHKGFHVYVLDFKYPKYPEDPKERGHYFEKVKKKIHEEILSEGIGIDPNLWDLYRVVRVPYTLNATTMLPAVWVRSIKHLNGFAKGIKVEKKYPDKPVKVYSSTILVSSHVLGIPDRHALFIDIDKPDWELLDEVIAGLLYEEELSMLTVFLTSKGFNIYVPHAIQFRHVIRLKKKYHDDPQHIKLMKKKGFDLFRIEKKVYSIGVVHPAPKPFVTRINPYRLLEPKYPLSNGHLLLLEKLARNSIISGSYDVPEMIQDIPENMKIGKPEVKVVPGISVARNLRLI